MAYVDIADKQTLDQVKSTVDTISTTKIGSTDASASSGTASSGTLMAKNNKIITVIGDSSSTADTSSNNATTVFGKLKYIITQVTKIGASGDSSSTNTLFGRFKKVTDELSTSNTAVGTKNDTADASASTNNTIFSKLKYVANSAGTLLTNIGTNSSTADTGTNGSTTVFGKLKYLVTTVKSTATDLTSLSSSVGNNDASSSSTGTSLFSRMKYVTSWLTTARGTKIDNIGATGDTGGSTSAGTVMGKENAILSDTSTLLGRVTTARGTKIDNIGTATDSTASSSTGTVMGKLNRLISDNDADLVYMKEALAVTGSITTASFSNSTSAVTYKRIGNFAVSKAGKVTVLVNVNCDTNTIADTYVFISTTNTASPSASTAAGAVATSKVSTVSTSQRYFVCDLEATARTYYVYICVAANTTVKTTTINDIHASVTYTSSLRTLERGAVKSVQQQNLYRLGQTEYGGYISIDNVVPENCVVFAEMGQSTNPLYLGYTVMADRLYVYNMTGKVGGSLGNSVYFSGCIQIVEYY